MPDQPDAAAAADPTATDATTADSSSGDADTAEFWKHETAAPMVSFPGASGMPADEDAYGVPE